MEMAAPRGRVLFFGGLPKGKTHMRFPSNILHYQEVQVHGSYASRYRDQVQALDMLARDEGGIRGVVSRGRAPRRRARAPSSASARARCSRSSSSPEPRDAATTTTRRGDRRALRADIAAGRYRPGERLPAEPDLAGQLGVSRPTLREAFRAARTRRAWCGASTARAPTSASGRRCATTWSATSASPSLIESFGLQPGVAERSVGEEPARRGDRRGARRRARHAADDAAAGAHGGRAPHHRDSVDRCVPEVLGDDGWPDERLAVRRAGPPRRRHPPRRGDAAARARRRRASPVLLERAARHAAAGGRPGRLRRGATSPCCSRASTTWPTPSSGRSTAEARGDEHDGADLVVGIDVGSQGTCAQLVRAADGELLATAYEGYDVRYPRPGWAEQDPARLARRHRPHGARGDERRRRGPRRGALLRLAARRAGGGRRAGEPVHDAIIWMDRRGDEACGDVAERIAPERLYERTGTNLDGGHVAAKIAWLRRERARRCTARARALPAARAPTWRWRSPAARPSTRRTPRRRCCSTRARAPGTPRRARPSASTTAPLAEVLPADARARRAAPGAREALGLAAGTLVVCGCGDEMAATLGRRRRRPGRRLQRRRHRRADLRRHPRARASTPRAWSSATPTPTPRPGCWRTRASSPAAATAGSATTSGSEELAQAGDVRVDVYELLNELAATAPPGLRRRWSGCRA